MLEVEYMFSRHPPPQVPVPEAHLTLQSEEGTDETMPGQLEHCGQSATSMLTHIALLPELNASKGEAFRLTSRHTLSSRVGRVVRRIFGQNSGRIIRITTATVIAGRHV